MHPNSQSLCSADQIRARLRFLPRINATDEHGSTIPPRYIHILNAVLQHQRSGPATQPPMPILPQFQRPPAIADDVRTGDEFATVSGVPLTLQQGPKRLLRKTGKRPVVNRVESAQSAYLVSGVSSCPDTNSGCYLRVISSARVSNKNFIAHSSKV
jgi:hypothetical protein